MNTKNITLTVVAALALVASASAWGHNPGADPTARQCRRSCASNCGADLNPTACKRTCEAEHRCSAKPSPAVAFWPAASARTCNDVLECPGREGDGASCLHLSGDRDPTRKVCCAAGDHRARGAHFRCARVATGTGPRNQCDWDEQCVSGRCDLETHHCVEKCRVEAPQFMGDANVCPDVDLCLLPLWQQESHENPEAEAAAAKRTLGKEAIKLAATAVETAVSAMGAPVSFLIGPLGDMIADLAFPDPDAVCEKHTGTEEEQGLCLWGLTKGFVIDHFNEGIADYNDNELFLAVRGVREQLETAKHAFETDGDASVVGHAAVRSADFEMERMKPTFLPAIANRRILGTHFAQFASLHLAIKGFMYSYAQSQPGANHGYGSVTLRRQLLTNAVDEYSAYGTAAARIVLRQRLGQIGEGAIPADLDLFTADLSRACTDRHSGFCNVGFKGSPGMFRLAADADKPKVTATDAGPTCVGVRGGAAGGWKTQYSNFFMRDMMRGGTLTVDPAWTSPTTCSHDDPAAVEARRCLQARFDAVKAREVAMWTDVVLDFTQEFQAVNVAVCGRAVCNAEVAAEAAASVSAGTTAAVRRLRGSR